MFKQNKHLASACLYASVSSILFTVMSSLMKVLTLSMPQFPAIFLRFVIGLLLFIPVGVIKRKQLFSFRKPKLYLTRALISFTIFVCIIYALEFIPVANAIVLKITYPLFIPLILRFFFNKTLSWGGVFGIVVGFIGVIFLLNPSGRGFTHLASLLALAGGFLSTFVFISIRKLSRTESPEEIALNYYLFAIAFSLIPAILQWSWPSVLQWILIAALAASANLYQFCIASALRKASSIIVSPIMFSSIFFGIIIDWIVWHNLPNLSMIIGSILIMGGITISIYYNQKQVKKFH